MRSSTTRLALIGAAVALVAGPARAGDVPKPVVCGSRGCTPLSTSTLQGLLTLPAALQPAAPPPLQPFLLFRVEDFDGVRREVVYVPRDADALLGFADESGWRRVPADDAKLLADAIAGTTPYAAPAAGTPLGGLFAAREGSRWRDSPWVLLAALLGLSVLGVTASTAVRARRSG
jgi:hypothetical protein